jgi:SAM-dependent methyltransferase
MAGVKTEWDYTDHAAHYDKRADYDAGVVADVLARTGCAPGNPVAEIGAGTGKLTKILLNCGLIVKAVEPNDAMRSFGRANTEGKSVTWLSGTGENTGLPASAFHAVFFGSSFNVVKSEPALREVSRILVPNGYLVCMWNHRNLDDEIQSGIERIIKNHIPSYGYGSRRENPTAIIGQSGLFSDVHSASASFVVQMTRQDVLEAWKSHATLKRQTHSPSQFDQIISHIGAYLESHNDTFAVPYTTNIYFTRLIVDKGDTKS